LSSLECKKYLETIFLIVSKYASDKKKMFSVVKIGGFALKIASTGINFFGQALKLVKF